MLAYLCMDDVARPGRERRVGALTADRAARSDFTRSVFCFAPVVRSRTRPRRSQSRLPPGFLAKPLLPDSQRARRGYLSVAPRH